MLKKCVKRAFVFLLCVSYLVINPHFSFFSVKNVYALPSSVMVKGTSVNVRSGPGTSYSLLGTVPLGYKLTPTESLNDATGNGKTWYRFRYNNQNAYIRSDFTKEMSTYVYDAAFENDLNIKGFPESYKEALRDLHANYPLWTFYLQNVGLDFDYVLENELVGTRTLVNSTSISSYKSNEDGKYDYTTSTWPTFDGNAWVAASKEVTAAYLDPRNFLYAPYVFQFELQTFNANVHTLAGIMEMVKGTFLDAYVTTDGISTYQPDSNAIMPGFVTPMVPSTDAGIIYPGSELTPYDPSQVVVPIIMNNVEINAFTGTSAVIPNIETLGPASGVGISSSKSYPEGVGTVYNSDYYGTESSYNFTYLPQGNHTYAEVIYDACRQVNVNPYVIVSMILQEQGKDGSDSVSGTNAKFPGIYNFGNINAYAADGLTPIENGLKYASTAGSYNRPWNTKEKGIYGLCDFYANSYVKLGQDTFYLKKWNVQGNNIFKHQYMTNVLGAAQEGQLLGSAYDETLLQMPHEFKIPYYTNMSETRYEVPTGDGSPNNKLKSLSVANYILTPTFDPNVSDYSIIVDANVNSVLVSAEPYDSKAAIGGVGNIMTVTSYTTAIIYCVAENGSIRQYNIHIYKKGAESMQVLTPDTMITPIIIGVPETPTNIQNSYNNWSDIVIPNISDLTTVQIGVGPGQ